MQTVAALISQHLHTLRLFTILGEGLTTQLIIDSLSIVNTWENCTVQQ